MHFETTINLCDLRGKNPSDLEKVLDIFREETVLFFSDFFDMDIPKYSSAIDRKISSICFDSGYVLSNKKTMFFPSEFSRELILISGYNISSAYFIEDKLAGSNYFSEYFRKLNEKEISNISLSEKTRIGLSVARKYDNLASKSNGKKEIVKLVDDASDLYDLNIQLN